MDPFREVSSLTPNYGFGLTAQAMRSMGASQGPALAPWPSVGGWDTVGPADPMGGDFEDFVQRMRRLKQEALQQAPPTKPSDPDKDPSTQTGPLSARAHGFYKGDEFVPVKSIRIFEVGNYNKRSLGSFNGNWYESEYSHRMDSARVGKDYRVVVTWGDGSTQERDVQMEAGGTSVDVWKY